MKKTATNTARARKSPSPGVCVHSDSILEDLFDRQLRALGLYFEREVKFHPTRKWRFDFAARQFNLAIEIEGGTWSGGRHNRGGGFRADCEKYNAAVMMGYAVLRFTDKMVKTGEAARMVERFINGRITDQTTKENGNG